MTRIRKAIVLIDGEHYPPVIRRALDELKARGDDLLTALLVGGTEKLGQVPLDVGVPVVVGDNREEALVNAILQHNPEVVLDLSDEPVLGNRERFRMACVCLAAGVAYEGADFRFDAPLRPHLAARPSVGVFGMGKRTGKTAVAAHTARALRRAGMAPVMVTMGRGGPRDPQVARPGAQLTAESLVALADSGKHAASDYLEDALVSGAPAVGAWRCGSGLAGRTNHTNFARAVEIANALGGETILFEGSGSAMPPVHWDTGIFVCSAAIPAEYLCGYLGGMRVLLSDLVVLTMCEEPITSPERLSAVTDCIRSAPLHTRRVVQTVFRPHPLENIKGRRVWFATTAPSSVGVMLSRHLEENYGCELVGISHSLSRREQLRDDLEKARDAEILLTELKAAAVDVVARYGLENGMQVVFADNRPLQVHGEGNLDEILIDLGRKAHERFSETKRTSVPATS